MLCFHSNESFFVHFVTLKVLLQVGWSRRNLRSILSSEIVRARANPAGRPSISASIVTNSCDSHFRSDGSCICLFVSSLFAVFGQTEINEWSIDGS
jgi:hypothetical protein